MPQSVMLKKLKLNVAIPSRTNTKNDVLFVIGDWNEKAGIQEIPRVTGKFGHGGQMKQGKG